MYSSCLLASSAASSVGIDWFWPSGSSVTRKVDFFERASTSVWTFRLPYRVSRAVGIFAASVLTSAGLGFSITRAASGSRNSIFATQRSFPRTNRWILAAQISGGLVPRRILHGVGLSSHNPRRERRDMRRHVFIAGVFAPTGATPYALQGWPRR